MSGIHVRDFVSVSCCLASTLACAPADGTTDQVAGVATSGVHYLRVRGRADLIENSAAAMSRTQPGVLFTINDSGGEPLLFALDTAGGDRGVWRLTGATNGDWEAASVGPCSTEGPGGQDDTRRDCVYVGDVGDNSEARPHGTIYRVAEPRAQGAGYEGSALPERVTFRYPDGPHDVEAMYVGPTGVTTLITKRARKGMDGALRPALVFELPATAWGRDGVQLAALVDSLPIVPGSASRRSITDAALSTDARHVAVRTYSEVYVFAADTATGRVVTAVTPTRCNVRPLQGRFGEGVTWLDGVSTLLLTAEGRDSPMVSFRCALPPR